MLDNNYISPTYNSYYADIAAVNAAIIGLNGVYDISKWEALETTISVSTLVVVSNVATVTTLVPHNYLTGQEILISGAIPNGLNGLQTVTVISTTEFTYPTLEADVSATGVITSTYSDDVTKENLILAATKDCNSFNFLGATNQSINSPFNMQFPRSGLTYSNGVSIPSTEVPQCIFDYVAIRITERLANLETGVIYNGAIKRQKVGKLEQEFHNPKDVLLVSDSLEQYPSFQCLKDFVSGIGSGIVNYVERT
jgi:hypothetical protein